MFGFNASRILFVFGSVVFVTAAASGRDFVLVLGGGYSPEGNQASLERNVLFFQRVLAETDAAPERVDTFFSDGDSRRKDVQVIDVAEVPKANRLMAEFFGTRSDLGLRYRDHQVPSVRGALHPDQVRRWFAEVGPTISDGDRLMIYVTAHGQRSRDRDRPYNTSIAMWNNTSIDMRDFARLLDGLPEKIDVVMVMVQCYTGGFSHLIFRGGDPDNGISPQRRVGFYATVHDRPAAGCTPDADETTYAEYSTYFWAAISGIDRMGQPLALPDYDGDGRVSFDEAHAYTIVTSETIDLPVKTSGEYLTLVSHFDEDDERLLKNDEPYGTVLKYASPIQRHVLESLSTKLGLSGESRLEDAWEKTRPRRSRGRSRRGSDVDRVRKSIASDVQRRWPELANLLNPRTIELLTTDQSQFIQAVEGHSQYERYLELKREDDTRRSGEVERALHDRFLRVADNVLMAENLRRLDRPEELSRYEALVRAERAFLPSAADDR